MNQKDPFAGHANKHDHMVELLDYEQSVNDSTIYSIGKGGKVDMMRRTKVDGKHISNSIDLFNIKATLIQEQRLTVRSTDKMFNLNHSPKVLSHMNICKFYTAILSVINYCSQ